MPTLRPFRALRFDPARVPDASSVVCPPYDVISPDQQARLLARDPHNLVRLELPRPEPNDTPDARYRRAARDLAAWRTSGVLRKDPAPSIYVYEQRYAVPGGGAERTQRGFFARLKLEPFGHGSGVLPHERTMSAPKEDRYNLLRATGANLSAVMGVYRPTITDPPDGAAIEALMTGTPAAEATDDDGVRHRLWVAPSEGGPTAPLVAQLLERASAVPMTIADGHHRYETALRYQEERGRNRACESDPAFDYTLVLLFDSATEPLTVLATHRVVRGAPSGGDLLDAAGALFEVERVASRDALIDAFAPAMGSPGEIGIWTGGSGAILRPRYEALDALMPAGASEALRRLDVTVLSVALERLLALPPSAATVEGGRLRYTKDAAEAISMVDTGDGDAAFLLRPTPVEAIEKVAAAGEVMPQKSTYFFPKAITGLVINPHEG